MGSQVSDAWTLALGRAERGGGVGGGEMRVAKCNSPGA